MGLDKGFSTRKVPKYAVALVAIGGVLLVVLGAGIAIRHLSCSPLPCTQGAELGTSGAGGLVGYPPQAARDLAWADIYWALFVVAFGVIVILISLKPFRRGEKWAWYAMLVFVATGILQTAIIYLAYSYDLAGPPLEVVARIYILSGLPQLLGVLLSVRSFFGKKSSVVSPPS